MKFKLYTHLLFALCIIFGFAMWLQNNTDTIYFSNLLAMTKSSRKLYVLQWTSPNTEPFAFMRKGQETFKNRNCLIQNCYVTSNRNLLYGVESFDVILFHGPEILRKDKIELPEQRSIQQSYVFTSMESSAYYPARDDRYNGVFNFTWTYKLNSEVYYGYMIIKDKAGEVIGPSDDVAWISVDEMLPLGNKTTAQLANKSIAAAWFVSNCAAPSRRLDLARKVMKELEKYNMVVDIYGKCGTKNCLRDRMADCLKLLQTKYYFYFAFENSMSDDYVTEKLLHALQNYAVPVVYGGADYRRFMPDGIYLNAGELTVEELVRQMVGIIKDKERYHNLFKWHNHYSYHNPEESTDTDPYCQFCNYINNVRYLNQSSIKNFKDWWNPHV